MKYIRERKKESAQKILEHTRVGVAIYDLYYYMRNYCNLIGLEQWYFSLI